MQPSPSYVLRFTFYILSQQSVVSLHGGNNHEEPSHSAVQIGGGACPAAPSDYRLGRTHGGVRAGLVRLSQGRGRQHGRRALQSRAGYPLLFLMVSALVGGTARAPDPPCPVVGASYQKHPR